MFVMGDHRLVSQDARCQGPVPIDNVIGRAFVVVWPTSRFTSLTVPDNWKAYAAAHPVGAGPLGAEPARRPDPATTAAMLPFLVSVGVSARSGLWLRPRRRRLRS
jgi:signal peptidase I